MIYVYWPKKPIPEWLEKVRFEGIANPDLPGPDASHNGYGVVFTVRQHHVVWRARGCFMLVHNPGMECVIIGGGKGVFLNASFRVCIEKIVNILYKENQ